MGFREQIYFQGEERDTTRKSHITYCKDPYVKLIYVRITYEQKFVGN